METFLPIVIAGIVTYLLARLVAVHITTRAAIFVALSSPAWYAIYRLETDLHANLFAVTLFLFALVLLSSARSIRDPRSLSGLAIIGLASFTHIESTVFLVAVTLASSMTKLRPYPFRLAFAATVTIIPALYFYIVHILQLTASSGGTLQFSAPEPFESWIIALGPLIPLTIVGLVWSIVRPRSWLEIFASTWGIGCLVIGFSQYVTPQTIMFAQRAVILIPTPLLAGLGAYRLNQTLPGMLAAVKSVKIPTRLIRIGIPAILLMILAISWPVTSLSVAPNEKIFLTSAEALQLDSVRANIKFSSTPIFVFNDVDEFAGGLANLYDNWLGAKIGPHLSYLGLTDYLVRLEQTPFSNTVSQTISAEFWQQILAAGITTRASLLQHPMIIMSEFYRPFPLPTYLSPLFVQVSPGIFMDNATRLASLGNVTLPLYIIFGAHSGGWYGTPASWTESLHAYEVFDSVPPVVQVSFPFATPSKGTYTLGLRYWDGSGNNFTVEVDGNPIGTIAYNNTLSPVIRYFHGVPVSQGTHSVTIVIGNAPSVARRYASLDYLVLSTP